MKIKQTVAAVCLAAIMATSVGAAAKARTTPPIHSDGEWKYGYGENRVGDLIYSEFETKICGNAWTCVQNDIVETVDKRTDYGTKSVSKIRQKDGRTKLQKLFGVKMIHHEFWDHWGSIK